MPKLPSITDAEWHIMKILWDRPAQWLPAADIIEPVSENRSIHHRTARTLLARLVKKGAVDTRSMSTTGSATAASSGYLYRAKVSRDAVIRAESRTFLWRVFDGNAAPALVHLLHQNRDQLSPDELQELRDLLTRNAQTKSAGGKS
jgi:BlaI family transcriptional regulator, penicillinase repressor